MFVDRALAQLATWIPAAQDLFDVRIFVGVRADRVDHPQTQHFPYVRLDAADGYAGLPDKVQAICQWARSFGYEKMFKCDDDTYVVPQRLDETCPVPQWQYVGNVRHASGNWNAPYASGFGYWLGMGAMNIIAVAQLTSDPNEDRWVGNTLARNGIDAIADPSNYRWLRPEYPVTEIWKREHNIGHAAAYAEFSVERMHAVHDAYKKLYPTYARCRRKPRSKAAPWNG